MKTKLIKYRVQKFRSIEDSGWIDTDKVGCLVGTNESGKTNILLALWKLNPANNEPINPLTDYPRKLYHTYSNTDGREIFISPEFEISDQLAKSVADLTGWHFSLMKRVIISRQYNGNYKTQLSKDHITEFQSNELKVIFESTLESLKASSLKEKEAEPIFEDLIKNLDDEIKSIPSNNVLVKEDIDTIILRIQKFLADNYKRKTNINSFYNEYLISVLKKIAKGFEKGGIVLTSEAKTKIRNNIPTFVYYSDYGNLDSEIYLPHVIENFERDNLGEKERAKVRSLKVLFEFVNLSPIQILELGKESLPIRVITRNQYGVVQSEKMEEPEEQDISLESEQKKEREILLQSASSTLTEDFKQWWKQGNYKFRFQADGNHFRIWVSDDKRSEEIELEGRSRGLQWFFSFFLVFLVESKDSHSNCNLLLDEPGLSLHPLAQFDLTAFFNSLSKENQLVYTTHSPFMVNPENLGGVYAMYVGDDGKSVVSPDLRANKKIAEKSIYPIHAAIGITVSDTLLIGCQPVLVEGASDQIYLQLMKTYALSQGKYVNEKELVFIPTGGVRGMSPVIKIITGRDNDLPFVLLDSDSTGKEKRKTLEKGLYKSDLDKIIEVSDLLGEGEYEIEDLVPSEDLARIFAKQYRRVNSEDEFDYLYDSNKPIIDQMEEYADYNGYKLELGWKVELAKEFQKSFDRILNRTDETVKEKWIILIEKLTGK